MDNRAAVREFLISRRPSSPRTTSGSPTQAGVSVEYYSKTERGGFAGVSPAILHTIARALRLDAAEPARWGRWRGRRRSHHQEGPDARGPSQRPGC